MRKLLSVAFLLFIFSANAQLEDIREDIIVTASSDTSWKQQYRESPEKINALLHTKLDLKFDYSKSYVIGKAWLTLKPYFYPTDSLTLDAKGMDIQEVSLSANGKNTPLKYTYDKRQLRISLGRTYKNDQTYTIAIKYIAKPDELPKGGGSSAITDDKGLYFINPKGEDKNKPTQIWTQGETEHNSAWFPTIDKPNQKTTQEITLTVPGKYVTLSNGLMTASKKNTDGTRTDTWKMDLPHAPYLVFIGVGDFAVIKDKYKNIPVDYYVEKEYAPYAKQIFGLTPEMMAFFSKKTGVEYPWPKYAQMVGRDFVSGAMENTTATLHRESAQQNARELVDGNVWEDVIAHELFHHWFGNYVTAESWSNLTMNESFANYSEYLWREYKYGKESADAHLHEDFQAYLMGGNFRKNLVRFHYSNKEDMFDAVSYNKGGNILHMLRHLIGDDAFFTSLNRLLVKHKFGSVEAHDLRLAIEEVTGKDMNWFFNQWYYGNGHPQLDISYAYQPNTVTVTIEQKQKNAPVFRLPLDIDIHEPGKKIRHRVWMDKARQAFTFPVTQKPQLVNVDADKILVATSNDQKSLEQYIYQYKNAGNFQDRREAVEYALNNIRQAGALDFLVNSGIADPSYVIRRYILYSIDPKMLNEAAYAKIENMARTDKHRPTRAAAMDILSYTRNPKYEPVFLANVNDSSYSVSGAALQALSMVNKEKAMSLLPELKKDAKGKLKVAIDRLDMLNRTEADFDEVFNDYKDMHNMSDKAEYTFDFMAYMLSLTDADKFKSALDEVLKFTETIAGNYPSYKEAVYNFLKEMAKQKLIKKASAPNPAAIQQQIDYINSKIK